MSLKPFRNQTWALIKKNLIIICVRSWFTTLLRYIIPIAITAVLWNIPNFVSSNTNGYGMGPITPVPSLENALGNGKLVIVRPSSEPASDLQLVLDKIVKPLGDARISYLNSTKKNELLDSLDEACPIGDGGIASCFAAVVFHDSPLTPGGHERWKYDIRTAPKEFTGRFNTHKKEDPIDKIFLPLQIAVENAIINKTDTPEFGKYSQTPTQEQADEEYRTSFINIVEGMVMFFVFITAAFTVQHVSAMIAKDRESGMSDLIDSMSGGAAWSRVVSYVVAFDIAYLPLWVILGCLNWALLLKDVSPAIVIFWQILGGWSLTSGAVFATTFFKKSQAASIAVVIASFLLTVGGTIMNYGNEKSTTYYLVLSFFLPPIAWILGFGYLICSERILMPINLTKPMTFETEFHNATPWTTDYPMIFIFIFLIIHIFGFTALAALSEKLIHGKRKRHADFSTTSSDSEHVAVRAAGLVKAYKPHPLNCKRRKPFVAVDGLDLVSHKNQVLCLLGPNGSGKTTTLDMLAGVQAPTSGSITLNALPTQLGVCPQKNVLWNHLTVREHLDIWNILKGGKEDAASIDRLVEKCDLASKINAQAKTLSGGMKRKLQLACMLIGGSNICLLDEVTSGLDPLSRRAIWNVILSERSHRTMILTTHFLDEAEVLSDEIVILSLGKTKCSGTPAQLKSQFGGGYNISLPNTVDVSHIKDYPVTAKGDQYICTVPDSKTAVAILTGMTQLGGSKATVTGPTIEDVFLNVSEQAKVEDDDGLSHAAPHVVPTYSNSQDSPLLDAEPAGRVKSFFNQASALFLKRCIILRSQWWIYLFAMALPLAITAVLQTVLINFRMPQCSVRVASEPYMTDFDFYISVNSMVIGPVDLNQSLITTGKAMGVYFDDPEWSDEPPLVKDSLSELGDYVSKHTTGLYSGAMWMPNDTAPTIFIPMEWNPPYVGVSLLNLANQARSGVNITGAVGELRVYTETEYSDSLFYIIIVCLMQAVYPAFFAIYPAFERRTQVRGLQYSNGIRPAPLLFAYLSFDFIFVLLIAAISTVLIKAAAPFWGLGGLFIVLLLYGMAATMLVYFISRLARSQPGAFVMSVLISGLMYALALIAVMVVSLGDDVNKQAKSDGVAFGLGLIFPIQNVFRAMELGYNSNAIRCRPEGTLEDSASIYAYGGPILLLIVQTIALFLLTVYMEGISLAWFTRKSKTAVSDSEQLMSTGRSDVDAEKMRVVASEVDLLRLLNVSKRFGNNIAVDDVSLGLRSGEIMALLGPNGAGKTTTINMIRGDLAPDTGNIFLEGIDTHKNTRLAQQHLGICPQFDALDMLTVREHLNFYARCKNVPDLKNQVDQVMNLVGIAPYASRMAAKLSGGNKRKLSLAIALLGNPPVLILDEPSSAMDATSKRVLWKTLEAVSPGRSVLLTTHSMEEADALSTRAAILAKRVLAVGTVRELREAYSNEYHVHLVLNSAPTSSKGEMEDVASWVRENFGTQVQFDGENLGGQVRFIVPVDSPVPGVASGVEGQQSFIQYMIEKLESNKGPLGLDCYSINTATMERVFLSVMKNSDYDEDTSVEKRKWWQW